MRLRSAFASFAVALAACGDPRPVESARGGVAGQCASCHTSPGEEPPFRTAGSDPGAHDAHLLGVVGPALQCSECHTVPQTRETPGHLEDAPTDVTFQPGTLARTGGTEPVWNGVGCQAAYCHGGFPGGSTGNVPVWSAPRSASCGTCHGLPPSTGAHVAHQNESITCATCHGTLNVGTHVNGAKDVFLTQWNPSLRNCAAACHGERPWP
jgi:predicted CxxxxCH...CXXCH cytochrome family protein